MHSTTRLEHQTRQANINAMKQAAAQHATKPTHETPSHIDWDSHLYLGQPHPQTQTLANQTTTP